MFHSSLNKNIGLRFEDANATGWFWAFYVLCLPSSKCTKSGAPTLNGKLVEDIQVPFPLVQLGRSECPKVLIRWGELSE